MKVERAMQRGLAWTPPRDYLPRRGRAGCLNCEGVSADGSEVLRAKSECRPKDALVADFSRMTKAKPADRDFYAAIDAGFISQNVYLYCASAGLATVVHELDRPPLAQAMRLRPEQRIIIAQSIGFPK